MNQTWISFLLGMLKSTAVMQGRIGMDLKHTTAYQEWFHNASIFILPAIKELRINWKIIMNYSSVYMSIAKINIFQFVFLLYLEIIGSAHESFDYVWEDTSICIIKVFYTRNVLIKSRKEFWSQFAFSKSYLCHMNWYLIFKGVII